MSERLPDSYFAEQYAHSEDPWSLADRWYDRRKYAITVAMLPLPRYRHAFEPGCSVGVLSELLAERCDEVTATDVAPEALAAARRRLDGAGLLGRVHLRELSLDDEWPSRTVDLVVLSEVAYYLGATTLRRVLDRECARLDTGTAVVAAHWRHPVADYPLTGDQADEAIAATEGMHRVARYRDDDVVISVLSKGESQSVAQREGVPGAAAC